MVYQLKKYWSHFITPLYLTTRWNAAITISVLLFVLRFFLPWLGVVPYLFLLAFVIIILFEWFILFAKSAAISAVRSHSERFSNGDNNPVTIDLTNNYSFTVTVEIIDEIPVQFQRRDILFTTVIEAGKHQTINYQLRPVKRGAYYFGTLNLYVASSIGFVKRRYKQEQHIEVPVYPSYIQMRKYQLMAVSNRLSETGIKKVRRLGHSLEFEQVKEYVQGDDYRTLNWKATARKGQLMVNNFTDEKSQQVYCIIDKGRVMKMPFEAMSLLDYAINAALVLTNIALLKQDKAGLITFGEQVSAFLPASNRPVQMESVLEVLYNQKTRYLESDFELLYATIRRKISQRSFIILFTNFETLTAMRRYLPYLRKIAAHHLLLTIFFENTELKTVITAPATSVEEVYTKTIAEKFSFEKKMIAKELQQYGILSILTPPADLTINTINKYLELKARQAI